MATDVNERNSQRQDIEFKFFDGKDSISTKFVPSGPPPGPLGGMGKGGRAQPKAQRDRPSPVSTKKFEMVLDVEGLGANSSQAHL